MTGVSFKWKFVLDGSSSPWTSDPAHTTVQSGTKWFDNIDACVADALQCDLESAKENIEKTFLIIETKISGKWASLTDASLRQTLDVFAARRLFYPSVLYCSRNGATQPGQHHGYYTTSRYRPY